MSKNNSQTSEPITEELKQYLNVYEESKVYILIILIAVFIIYCSTSIEEKKLLCGALGKGNEKCCEKLPNTSAMNLTSTFLVFLALIYFYLLSLEKATTPVDDCLTQYLNYLSYDAALLVLVTAGIRLYIAYKKCFG